MTAHLLLAVLLRLLHRSPAPDVTEAIVRAGRADCGVAATAVAVCDHESQLGAARVPHLLCGAHVRTATGAWDRSPVAQVGAVVRRFGGRRTERALSWALLAWRCGADAVCREGAGPLYARSVLAVRRRVMARLCLAGGRER